MLRLSSTMAAERRVSWVAQRGMSIPLLQGEWDLPLANILVILYIKQGSKAYETKKIEMNRRKQNIQRPQTSCPQSSERERLWLIILPDFGEGIG